MLDPVFIRPIAHRGLHDAARGVVENTGPAFQAAIDGGYGIECDLQPAVGGMPVVFHDEELDRLVAGKGAVAALQESDLARLTYKASATRILTFAGFLELVAGRVPLLVEIKSVWGPPDRMFLGEIARLAGPYRGPIALMSFDPAVMAVMRELLPAVPRGIVSGIYRGEGWWQNVLDEGRRESLSHLLESGPAEPAFFAYHVADLPTPVTRFAREAMRLPLFTWTVRKAQDWATARRWADAPIFEGAVPKAA
jgi:glycerophosphoryl diester phosphodiesterase